jgi:hypothetical protein
MGPIAAQPNVYPCDVPSVWIQGDPIAPNGGLREGFEKDKWSNGWFGPISERTPRSKNAPFAGNS